MIGIGVNQFNKLQTVDIYGSISWIYEWDGYSYEMWMNSSTNQSGYQTGTIDEYANKIEYISYDCSVAPCVPTRKTIFEFDCTMFEPIPM